MSESNIADGRNLLVLNLAAGRGGGAGSVGGNITDFGLHVAIELIELLGVL